MTDLRERFDQYHQVEVPDLWDQIEERAATKSLEPVPIRRRRPLVVALAAFISVLVAAVGFLIARSDTEPAPTGTQPPPTVDEQGGPVSSPDELLSGWQQAKGTAGFWLNDLAVGADGLIAVSDGTGDLPGIWTSTDGLHWDMLRPPNVAPAAASGQLEGITAGGPGWVAVGHDTIAGGTLGTKGAAAVWTSPNGRTWSRVPHTPALEGTGHTVFMWDVATDGQTLVAVGTEGISDNEWQAALWTSPDGLTWTRVDGFGLQTTHLSSIARFGSDFVAVGAARCDDGSECGAVWTSVDGQAWNQMLIDEPLRKVTAWDGRLVAIGHHVWTSEDARTWTKRPIPDFQPTVRPTGPELSWLTDVEDVGSGVLVVGLSQVPVGDPDDPQYDGRTLGSPIAWYTEDATTWTDLSSAFPGDAELSSIHAPASQVFVGAYMHTTNGLLVWDSTAP